MSGDKRDERITTIGGLLDAIAAYREVWRENFPDVTDEEFRDMGLDICIDLGQDDGRCLPLNDVMMLEANEDGDAYMLVGDWPSR